MDLAMMHRHSSTGDSKMVKNKGRLAIKFITFVLAASFCVGMVNEWLKPKYYYNQTWPATNTFKDFYDLKKDTVDVLFLGSSHAMCSFNPQVLYDTYGITSYNLGSEQQSIVVSYYWLREALKYQSPKAVVLDTYMLHKFGAVYVYNEMNCSETAVRKAMDSMKPSLLKWEAAKAIEKVDPTQSALSYFLLNIRYHTRWTELGEDDYTETSMVNHGGIKGFTVFGSGNIDPSQEYTPFQDKEADASDSEGMVGSAAEYLDKITELCSQNNIQLILTNIPCAEPIGRYRATRDYAAAHNLPYYDFNEASIYKAVNYYAPQDLLSHPSYMGAEKITKYLGDKLANQYKISPREDPSFEKSGETYQHKLENIQLSNTTEVTKYLDLLQKDRYSVFLFAPTSYSKALNSEIMERLFALGFTTELRDMPDGYHYCAVKDGTKVREELTEQDLNLSGSIRDGKTIYRFCIDTSLMIPDSHTYSLTIDGTECGNRNEGINIIVYDNEQKAIIDSVNVNTNDPAFTVTR